MPRLVNRMTPTTIGTLKISSSPWLVLILPFVVAAGPAYAGVGGPPIAYTKGSSKGDAIYLVHPDGTGLTKLHQAAPSTRFGGRIERLAMLPGGGEVAFTQDSVILRVQKHHANGQPNGSAYNVTVPNNRCALGDVDYRADGTLVVSDGCFNVWTVPPGGTAATKLFNAAENVGAVRWMRDGSVLFHSGPLEAMRLRRWSGGTFDTIAPTTYFPPFLGMSRIANETAISDRSTYKVVDLSTGLARAGCKPAGNVRLSPNSSQILYRSSTGYLFVQKADCSGAAYRLAMGVGEALEWRAN